MITVHIQANNLEDLRRDLSMLDPELHSLKFEQIPSLEGCTFQLDDVEYVIEGVDMDGGEIPLLSVFRVEAMELKNTSDLLDEYDSTACIPNGITGYFTEDESPYHCYGSEFTSYTGWQFTPGGRYAWNIEGFQNGDLVGLYWLPLTRVINLLV